MPVKGYEGRYEVSNKGKVRSLIRKHDGKIRGNPILLKIGKLKTHCKTYNTIWLRNNGANKRFYVHRLVAMAFIPNLLNKPQVNHIDNNPLNNNVENLEWCTNSENQIHRVKTNGTKNSLGQYIHKNRTTFRVYVKGRYDACFKTIEEASAVASTLY
jgi:hypothetical protein